jgi:hypothetical protein
MSVAPGVSLEPGGIVSAESNGSGRHCSHSSCRRHTVYRPQTVYGPHAVAKAAPVEWPSAHQIEGGEKQCLSTRCGSCDFLAQQIATPATSEKPAVSGYRWMEASPQAPWRPALVLPAFLARGPPAA